MSTPASRWHFDATNPWIRLLQLPAVPENTAKLCDLVVPRLAPTLAHGRPTLPSVVTARVTIKRVGRRPLFAAKGRAKAVLDALHDKRTFGAKYVNHGVLPPLPDDSPDNVCGYALEITSGAATSLEYRVGSALLVQGGSILSTADVALIAPNDIGHQAKMLAALNTFAGAVGTSAWQPPGPLPRQPTALVVRHWPDRDEDNTWLNWIASLVDPRYQSHWPGAMLCAPRWNPMAVATIADATLPLPTRYELYG